MVYCQSDCHYFCFTTSTAIHCRNQEHKNGRLLQANKWLSHSSSVFVKKILEILRETTVAKTTLTYAQIPKIGAPGKKARRSELPNYF